MVGYHTISQQLNRMHDLHQDTVYLRPKALYEIPRVGSIQDCTNNPGNITAGYNKYDTLAIGYIRTPTHKFLVFPDSTVGFKALRMRIIQSKDQTIMEFMRTYGGSSYVPFMCRELKASPNDHVHLLLDRIDFVANLIAKYEGWKNQQKNYEFTKINLK
jgi:hypothetical protein